MYVPQCACHTCVGAMCVGAACMGATCVWLHEPEEGVGSLGTGVVGSCEPHQNSGTLQEQFLLLTAEPSDLTVPTFTSRLNKAASQNRLDLTGLYGTQPSLM